MASDPYGQCRTCRARVIWLRNTETGRVAPIDLEANPEGDVTVDVAATTYTIVRDPILRAAAAERNEIYARHFKTCPRREFVARANAETTHKGGRRMMIAPVVRLVEIVPHPDPDTKRLELARLSNGVTVVTGKHYRPNMLGVYLPPDRWLPGYLAEDLWLFGRATASIRWFEVRTITLRGVESPGLFSGCVYRKDASDPESEERFRNMEAAGGRPSRYGDGWITWPYWRQGWRKGDDVGVYLGVVPTEAWDHEGGMGPPRVETLS